MSASTSCQLALEFLALAEQLIAALPKGRSHLADHLSRASLSIVLNVAEGAGKVSAADKRRYDVIARESATESAALLDVWFRLELIAGEQHRTGRRCGEA
jgi:four helix bundle protein